jgi:hypothetical protein
MVVGWVRKSYVERSSNGRNQRRNVSCSRPQGYVTMTEPLECGENAAEMNGGGSPSPCPMWVGCSAAEATLSGFANRLAGLPRSVVSGGATVMFSKSRIAGRFRQLAPVRSFCGGRCGGAAWYDDYLRGRRGQKCQPIGETKKGGVAHRRKSHGVHRQSGRSPWWRCFPTGEGVEKGVIYASTPPRLGLRNCSCIGDDCRSS